MNNTETIEKLKRMRLSAMAQLHSQYMANNRLGNCTPDEYLAILAEHEWDHRQNNKIQRLMKQADFNQKATIAEISFDHNRNLDKQSFMRISTLEFLNRQENLIITGPSGVGKSFICQALGHQACVNQKKTLYYITARLFRKLKLSKVDGTYLKELKKMSTADLLILDDFGLQGFDNFARESLLDIIDDRIMKASTIISSQLPVSVWYEVIGEGTIADAILDRVVNSSHRIDLKGESMRKSILKKE